MAQILVLGGGVGGTLVANVVARKLGRRQAHVTVIDRTGWHVYQPGWLYVPFGGPPPKWWERAERGLLSRKVDLVVGEAQRIHRETHQVTLADGTSYQYDDLVIATGAHLAPEAIPGYADAAHHFYSPEAAVRLRDAQRHQPADLAAPPRSKRQHHCRPARHAADGLRLEAQAELYLDWFHITMRITVIAALSHGDAGGDLYRPSSAGPYPGVVVCLGVVPFGVDHPQVPHLGEALARAGFAALLYWSPAMRDFRLDPEDVEDIASAYEALLVRPDIDQGRSGLLGTCVGGAFALMGASSPRIRDRVNFVLAYAAYASMWTLARDIACASRCRNGRREPWAVDPLTRKVFVHTVTALLEPSEAERLRDACADRGELPNLPNLSEAGRMVLPLLTALDPDEAEAGLQRLPAALQERLTAMSPMTYLRDLRAPLLVLLHDCDDVVVPMCESQCLRDALAGRGQVRYTEFTAFKHLDPTKGKPSAIALARELVRFGRAIFPLFERATA